MKKLICLLVASAAFFIAAAQAQTPPKLGSGQVLGNPTASTAQSRPSGIVAVLNAACTLSPSTCAFFFGHYSPQWYGALCDGVTDDTVAIQAALDGTPYGGTIVFPNNLCLVKGSGTAILTRATPINMQGAGMYTSGLIADATVPSTRAVLLIQPAAHSTTRGYSFRDMTIFASGTGSNATVEFNSNAASATDTNLAEIVFERTVIFTASTGTTPFAIYFNNGIVNPNGGFFNVTVRDSVILGGIRLLEAGDTFRIQDNILTGQNAAVSGSQIIGGGQLLISGNNITNYGGGVVMDCAFAMRITHNEFEQQVTSTEANNAIIDLNAGVCTMDGTLITENQIQAVAGVGSPILIKISVNNINVKLDSNRLATPTSYTGVVNASTSLICGNNIYTTGSPEVSGTACATTWGNGH